MGLSSSTGLPGQSYGTLRMKSQLKRPSRFLQRVGGVTQAGLSPIAGNTNLTALDRTRNRLASLGAPEYVAPRASSLKSPQIDQPIDTGSGKTLASTTDEAVAEASPKVSMQELIHRRLAARRQVLMNQTYAHFKADEYQQVCDRLNLAMQTVIDDPAEKAYMKMLYTYASLSYGQYAQALNALSWVLRENPQTGELPDPNIFSRLRNIRALYSDPRVYSDLVERINQYVGDDPQNPVAMALRALAAWGGSDEANAVYNARRLSEALGQEAVWGRVYELMVQARTQPPAPTAMERAP